MKRKLIFIPLLFVAIAMMAETALIIKPLTGKEQSEKLSQIGYVKMKDGFVMVYSKDNALLTKTAIADIRHLRYGEYAQDTTFIHDGQNPDLDDVTGDDPNIVVEPGGELNVHWSDIRVGVITVISTGSESGQVHGADYLDGWRFFMEYILNPLGSHASPNLWYAFAVPFEVDIETGITRAYGKKSHVSGEDFLILEYDGWQRATTGKGWKKKLTGTLVPGTFYMIGIEGNCNRWLFEKKSGASIQGNDHVNLNSYFAGNSDNGKHNGWNGKGNTKLEYMGVDFSGCEIDYLTIYDNSINDYTTILLSALNELCVGQPFFVQAPNVETMSVNFGAGLLPMPALMAHKAAEPLMHFTLSDGRHPFNMYLSMHEEAESTYTIGHDVMRMDGGNMSIPKCWTIGDDGTELSAHGITMPEAETIVPIGIYAPKDGEYQLEMMPRAMNDYEVEILHNGTYMATLFEGIPFALGLQTGTTNDYSLRIRRKMKTDISNVQGGNIQCAKVIIDDHLYILQGERIYDAQGKTIK